ncbi:MAG: hypothetical protein ACK42G_08790, partial [Candidatus Kapaibacteriota bacterium]
EQEQIVREMIPDIQELRTFGGRVFSIGTFYSKAFADMVCQRFRKFNLFTIVYNLENLLQEAGNSLKM